MLALQFLNAFINGTANALLVYLVVVFFMQLLQSNSTSNLEKLLFFGLIAGAFNQFLIDYYSIFEWKLEGTWKAIFPLCRNLAIVYVFHKYLIKKR